jgi:hypothetical protein
VEAGVLYPLNMRVFFFFPTELYLLPCITEKHSNSFQFHRWVIRLWNMRKKMSVPFGGLELEVRNKPSVSQVLWEVTGGQLPISVV